MPATSNRPVNNMIALDRALELLPVIPLIQQYPQLAFFERPFLRLDHGKMQHPKPSTSQPRILDDRLEEGPQGTRGNHVH